MVEADRPTVVTVPLGLRPICYPPVIRVIRSERPAVAFQAVLRHSKGLARLLTCVPARRCQVDVIFFLLPVALGLGLGAVVAFRWAVRDGQFDDLDTPPLRVLTDDAKAQLAGEGRS